MEERSPTGAPQEAMSEATGEASHGFQVASEAAAVGSLSTAGPAPSTAGFWQPWVEPKQEDGRREASLMANDVQESKHEDEPYRRVEDEGTEENLQHQGGPKRQEGNHSQQRRTQSVIWYNCSECRKNFNMSCNMTEHQRFHREDKLYQCEECGKNFNSRSNMTVHQRIHRGEKPYQCEECGTCFNWKTRLILHQRIHKGRKNL
ncbi:zinc finger and SCAN domain-containing protein 20-like [Rhineura floridana]|uniref:zinc finger and SCAN domain-containing protein 20-like n=1 Tax=Rhineura floridana TaxID=261503 RepID=UPI002AC8915A|nr:zinc finger and SCAN domain-containing protein 20-like [Rhineura floridana]XP_061478147.1 zinc finger and SCAN domain-containing protein 20-like [Rhineura floridana]